MDSIFIPTEDYSEMSRTRGTSFKKENGLFAAAKSGDYNTTYSLLASGVNKNAKDEEGNTALHFAVMNGRVDVARLLTNAGADRFMANKNDETPVDLLKRATMKIEDQRRIYTCLTDEPLDPTDFKHCTARPKPVFYSDDATTGEERSSTDVDADDLLRNMKSVCNSFENFVESKKLVRKLDSANATPAPALPPQVLPPSSTGSAAAPAPAPATANVTQQQTQADATAPPAPMVPAENWLAPLLRAEGMTNTHIVQECCDLIIGRMEFTRQELFARISKHEFNDGVAVHIKIPGRLAAVRSVYDQLHRLHSIHTKKKKRPRQATDGCEGVNDLVSELSLDTSASAVHRNVRRSAQPSATLARWSWHDQHNTSHMIAPAPGILRWESTVPPSTSSASDCAPSMPAFPFTSCTLITTATTPSVTSAVPLPITSSVMTDPFSPPPAPSTTATATHTVSPAAANTTSTAPLTRPCLASKRAFASFLRTAASSALPPLTSDGSAVTAPSNVSIATDSVVDPVKIYSTPMTVPAPAVVSPTVLASVPASGPASVPASDPASVHASVPASVPASDSAASDPAAERMALFRARAIRGHNCNRPLIMEVKLTSTAVSPTPALPLIHIPPAPPSPLDNTHSPVTATRRSFSPSHRPTKMPEPSGSNYTGKVLAHMKEKSSAPFPSTQQS